VTSLTRNTIRQPKIDGRIERMQRRVADEWIRNLVKYHARERAAREPSKSLWDREQVPLGDRYSKASNFRPTTLKEDDHRAARPGAYHSRADPSAGMRSQSPIESLSPKSRPSAREEVAI